MERIVSYKSESLEKFIIRWLDGRYTYVFGNGLGFNMRFTIEYEPRDNIIRKHLADLHFTGRCFKSNKEKKKFFDELEEDVYREYEKIIKAFGGKQYVVYMLELLSKSTELSVCFQFLIQGMDIISDKDIVLNRIKSIVFTRERKNAICR